MGFSAMRDGRLYSIRILFCHDDEMIMMMMLLLLICQRLCLCRTVRKRKSETRVESLSCQGGLFHSRT